MHELSLVEDLVDVIEDRLAAPDLAGRALVAIRLRVGVESGVLPDAMAFCWEAVVTATALAGSRLEIVEVDGTDLVLASLELTKEEPCARPAAAATPA